MATSLPTVVALTHLSNALASGQTADSENEMRPLVDIILQDYQPYNWLSKLAFHKKAHDPKDDTGTPTNRNSNESNVEKWILVAFCSICILAMIVCIVVLIVYKVRKIRRQRLLDQEDSSGGSLNRGIMNQTPSSSNSSRQRQPRQGGKSRKSENGEAYQQQQQHYMIPPLSTVSEKSEYLEYSAMGSALSRSMKSRGGASVHMPYRGSQNEMYYQTLLSVDQTHDALASGNIDLVRPKQHTLSETMDPIQHSNDATGYYRNYASRQLSEEGGLVQHNDSSSSALNDQSCAQKTTMIGSQGVQIDSEPMQMTIENQAESRFSPFDEPRA